MIYKKTAIIDEFKNKCSPQSRPFPKKIHNVITIQTISVKTQTCIVSLLQKGGGGTGDVQHAAAAAYHGLFTASTRGDHIMGPSR